MKFLGIIPMLVGVVIVVALLAGLPQHLRFLKRETSDKAPITPAWLMIARSLAIHLVGFGIGLGLIYLGYKIIT